MLLILLTLIEYIIGKLYLNPFDIVFLTDVTGPSDIKHSGIYSGVFTQIYTLYRIFSFFENKISCLQFIYRKIVAATTTESAIIWWQKFERSERCCVINHYSIKDERLLSSSKFCFWRLENQVLLNNLFNPIYLYTIYKNASPYSLTHWLTDLLTHSSTHACVIYNRTSGAPENLERP